MKLPSNFKWKSTGKTLGQGGQATVIQVYDENDNTQKPYALKALSRDKPEKAYKRFAQEIEALTKIDHPNIIKIFDHSEIDFNFKYYVMEYVPNSISLKKLLGTDKNPFHKNTIKSLTFFMMLMDSLNACASSDIIHRDLSPANILITENENIKIIDFGLCQITDSSTITLVDEGIGTQNYMSPECESGSEREISVASDIYSAGKLLWSVITNQFAFAREGAVFSDKSMNKLFPDQSNTHHLHHIFEKTIRLDPKDRWSSAYAAFTDCQKILHLIKSGYPPLESMDNICPTCGFQKIEPFQMSREVYSHSDYIHSYRCNYCGFIFHFDYKKRRDNLNSRKDLK